MRICRVSFAPITQIFERIPQRDHHLLSRLERCGHDVYTLRIAPAWRSAAIHLAYLIGLVRTIPDLSRTRADLILADGLEAGVVGWIAARAKRIPFVFDYRDHYSFLYRQQRDWRNPALVEVLERWLPKAADLSIVVDGRQYKACLLAGASTDRVKVISNGVDPDRFAPGSKDPAFLAEWGLTDRPVILYIGKITSAFNLPMVVEAMRTVVKAHNRACLVCVGDGPALADLRRLSQRLGLEQHVIFAGHRPHDRIPALIRSSDICIYPLRSVAALAIFEYMACGKPVVVPNADYDLSLPEGSCLPVEKSVRGFAEGMSRLLSDPPLCDRIGRTGREFARIEHSWDHLARAYETALMDLVKGWG
jgi:1,2-diacylglycerol 3-alpha-glucosyltransferase